MPKTSHTPDEGHVVPFPGQESAQERRRVRQSNDRDQRAEERGEIAPHNRGYDEAADGAAPPVANPVDEE